LPISSGHIYCHCGCGSLCPVFTWWCLWHPHSWALHCHCGFMPLYLSHSLFSCLVYLCGALRGLC